MSKRKEALLTNHMKGFRAKEINYNDYEVSFRRWLISKIDSESISIQEVRDRFQLSLTEYKKIIKRWQERYSDELHY